MQKLDLNKHDTLKVAKLIYQTDTKFFDFIFKDKVKTLQKIEKLVRAGNNNMGYERIMVVTSGDSDGVKGLLIYSCGLESEVRDEFKILRENLNFWELIKFKVSDRLDRYFASDLNGGDFYLAGVAVDENLRSKGIGTFILQKALKIAKKHGFERVVLDVDTDNKGALKLYQRLEFTVFNKKSVPWIRREIGVLNMDYIIKN